MKHMYTYRYVTEDDIDDIYSLICELEDTEIDRKKFNDVFYENVRKIDVYYLCVECDGKIVGFGSLHIQKLLHHSDNIGEIQELIIDSGFQGMGIGSEIVKRLMDIAVEKGCFQVEVSSGRKREGAHEFYKSLGFQKSHYKFTYKLI